MNATISDRIKEAMSVRNMKQAELVEKTGITKGALSSYISGRYEPKQTNTFLIAKALDVDVSWLMGNDVPMEPKTGVSNSYQLATIISKIRRDKEMQDFLNIYYFELSDDNKHRILDICNALRGQN